MDELKPCPFCGNKAEIHYTSSQSFATTKFFVGCNVCGVETPRIARTKKEAATVWNRRPTPENKPLTLERLRQMDGKPVWFRWQDSTICGYAIVNTQKQVVTDSDGWFLDFADYGKGWIAYTRKPEQEDTQK